MAIDSGGSDFVTTVQMASSPSLPDNETAPLRPKAESEADEKPAHGFLGKWTVSRILSVAGDALLILPPVFFIALTVMAGKLHDSPAEAMSLPVPRIFLVIPTIFPIVFSAIMGRFFLTYGIYRAERGIRLGALERLVGCQSLFSTVERQIALRHVGLFSLLIVAVWLLSPLGSQSAIRLLTKGSPVERTYGEYTISYLSPLEAAQLSTLANATRTVGQEYSYELLLQVAVTYQSNLSSPRDFKEFPKIPSAHTINESAGAWNPSQWYDTTARAPVEWAGEVAPGRTISYSSLLGVPIHGSDYLHGNSSFYLESRHWTVNCSHVENDLWSMERMNDEGWNAGFLMSLAIPYNMSKDDASWPFKLVALVGDPNVTGLDGGSSPRDFLYPVNSIYCSIGPQNILANMSCVETQCQVESMQVLNNVPLTEDRGIYRLLNTPDKDLGTDDSDDVWNPTFWNASLPRGVPQPKGLRMLFESLPRVLTKGYPLRSPYGRYIMKTGATLAEVWLYDPNTGYRVDDYHPWPDFSTVDLYKVSHRLEMLINTYWQSFYMSEVIVDGKFSPIRNGSDPWVDATFNSTIGHENIVCFHIPWAITLIAISFLLLFAAAGAFVLRLMTLAPDFFGFVSSSTRDNPHIDFPFDYSHMDGLERARLMKDAVVMVGDTKAGEAVGHISLMTGTDRTKRLRKGRLYD